MISAYRTSVLAYAYAKNHTTFYYILQALIVVINMLYCGKMESNRRTKNDNFIL